MKTKITPLMSLMTRVPKCINQDPTGDLDILKQEFEREKLVKQRRKKEGKKKKTGPCSG